MSLLVDHRAEVHVATLHAAGVNQLVCLFLEDFQEPVIDGFDDDGPRTGGALLSLESEGRCNYALGCCLEIGLFINDDGVLAPPFLRLPA